MTNAHAEAGRRVWADAAPAKRARALVLASLAALALLLTAAVAAPGRAQTDEVAGRTTVFVDGDLKKRTTDDHFAYQRLIGKGCHDVKVVRKEGTEMVLTQKRSFCAQGRATLTVSVNHGSVLTSTSSKTAATYGNPMAR